MHLTDTGTAPNGATLPFNTTDNNNRWGTWVRGSLYLSEFLTSLSYATDMTQKTVTLSVSNKALCKLHLPGDDLLASQCAYVREYAGLRTDRAAEITSQLGCQTLQSALDEQARPLAGGS